MPPSYRLVSSVWLACLLACSVVCCVAPDPASGQISRFGRWAASDAAELGRAMLRNAPGAAAAGAAIWVSSPAFDPGLNSGVRAWSSGSVDTFLDRANPLGGPGITKYVAGIFGASLLTRNTRLQDAAFTSLESLVYAGGISYGIKFAFGRGRPEDGAHPLDFRPFSGHSSFPSGHTTTAFAVIVPWVLYYPTPFTKALLVFPVGTALARMQRDKHWGSDVVAGGLIGALTARYLYRQHTGRTRPASRRPRIQLHLSGASVRYRF